MATKKKETTKAVSEMANEDFDVDFETLVQLPGSFADVWNFEENPQLDGILTDIREIEVTIKKKTQVNNIATFKRPGGELVSVWESTALEPVFDKDFIGAPFRIIYKGTKPLKGGQKFKQFEIFSTPAVLAMIKAAQSTGAVGK